jgi:hypothetical protein
LRSKTNTCPGLSDASPELTTTQCRLQSGVCPLTISRHCAAGSLAISAVTVSALGPSACVQVARISQAFHRRVDYRLRLVTEMSDQPK